MSQAALVFAPPGSQIYRTTNTLSATGGSGTGTVTYAVVSGPGQIIGSNKLNVLSGTGTVRVRAVRGADARYHASAGVTAAVTCVKAGQTISFPAIPDQRRTNSVALSATASSGLPVSFSVASGPGSIASGVLSFSGTGVVRVVARQAGNTAFDPAKPVTNRVVVTASGAVINDYDGNGISELAVFDNNIGSWYAFSLQTGKATIWNRSWGWAGAETVPGDYDGDKNADLAVFDTITGSWYVWSEVKGQALVWAQNWGWAGANPPGGRK